MGGWRRSCCCIGAVLGCGCGCRDLYDGLYGSCCCCPGICLGGTWWVPFARGICPSPETCIPEVLICCSCCIGCQRGRICCMKNTGWPGWKGRVMKAYWAKQNSIGLSLNIPTHSGSYSGLSNLKDFWQVNIWTPFKTTPFQWSEGKILTQIKRLHFSSYLDSLSYDCQHIARRVLLNNTQQVCAPVQWCHD